MEAQSGDDAPYLADKAFKYRKGNPKRSRIKAMTRAIRKTWSKAERRLRTVTKCAEYVEAWPTRITLSDRSRLSGGGE